VKYTRSDYQDVVLKQYEAVKEVTILVTPYCKGGCFHCLYERDKIGDRLWDKLLENVCRFYDDHDFEKHYLICGIEGGEIFSDDLLTDEYAKKLTVLIGYMHNVSLRSRKWYPSVATSLENVGEKGFALLKELHDRFPHLRINTTFSVNRYVTDEKYKRFWDRLKILKDKDEAPCKQLGISVMCTDGFPEREYLRPLAEFAKNGMIDFVEPHMFGPCSYSYKGINATEAFKDIIDLPIKQEPATRRRMPSLHHLDYYITAHGVKNGFDLLKRGDWIPEEEWNRCRDDEEYRLFGYQQVLDWYGCNDCPILCECQGMLWTSYYAQKNMYKHKRCLYK
jgi:hypothetical protein